MSKFLSLFACALLVLFVITGSAIAQGPWIMEWYALEMIQGTGGHANAHSVDWLNWPHQNVSCLYYPGDSITPNGVLWILSVLNTKDRDPIYSTALPAMHVLWFQSQVVLMETYYWTAYS